MSKQEKICFVIAPIGEEGSDTRRRSDQVLKHMIEPAAKDFGYKTIRADRLSEPGIITSQVIQHLVEDALVIADLTDHNANVFYELAIRHTMRKPIVQLIQKGQSIPFDVAATRTIQFDHQDLDSAAQAREELVKQIHSVEKDPTNVDTPISAAIDFQSLRRSDNPLEKNTVVIISLLQDVRSKLDELVAETRQSIGHPFMRERLSMDTYSVSDSTITLALRNVGSSNIQLDSYYVQLGRTQVCSGSLATVINVQTTASVSLTGCSLTPSVAYAVKIITTKGNQFTFQIVG